MAARRLCKVCLCEARTVVFQPCRHLVCCRACAEAVSSCPICRGRILRLDVVAPIDDSTGQEADAERTFDARREVLVQQTPPSRPAQTRAPGQEWQHREVARGTGGGGSTGSTSTICGFWLPAEGEEHASLGGIEPQRARGVPQVDFLPGKVSRKVPGTVRLTGEAVVVTPLSVDSASQTSAFLSDLRALADALSTGDEFAEGGEGADRRERRRGLIRLRGAFASARLDVVYAVQESSEWGSLADLQRRRLRAATGVSVGNAENSGGAATSSRKQSLNVPPELLACVARQVLAGLQFLHDDLKRAHSWLDLKAILLDRDGRVRVSYLPRASSTFDGLDSVLADIQSLCRTYMAPEQALGSDYGLPADVWSLGMLMHELAAGAHPFEGLRNIYAIFNALVMDPEPRLKESELPRRLCDFTASCLCRDAEMRLTASELRAQAWIAEDAAPVKELAIWLLESGC
eukprot:TRINITY_DN16506_c0_g4_i1.p1 TRINITY_DN16506_c0_g4~~TRINITY_DN16506_c0_g4_i1.p1  ORF type:complete len:520 (-),score=79.88 TRINITY_DN16506_c0_g4_i1:152-1534(-)